MKRDGIIEVCEYCGQSYHPMLRYTYIGQDKGQDKSPHGQLIYVCEFTPVYDDDGNFLSLDFTKNCSQKALDDGYEPRRDLTPTR